MPNPPTTTSLPQPAANLQIPNKTLLPIPSAGRRPDRSELSPTVLPEGADTVPGVPGGFSVAGQGGHRGQWPTSLCRIRIR